MKKRLIQLISWVIVVAIFLWVLASILPAEQAQGVPFFERIPLGIKLLSETLAHANLWGIVALSILYMVFLILVDSASTAFVINRFNCQINLKEMIPARAITFLIAVFNYQMGQLALPLYLKRTHKVPITEGTGTIFFIAAIDLLIVILLATIGASFIREGMLAKQIFVVGIIGIIGFIVNAWFWRTKKISKIVLAKIHTLPLLNKINPERSVFYTFQKASVKDILQTFVFRLPIPLAILTSLYLMILFFNESVPFLQVLIYMPVVMIISTIPIINVGSVGASQVSVVYFLKDYATEPTLLAVSLVWAIAINGIKVLLGAVFLTKYSVKLFQPEETTG